MLIATLRDPSGNFLGESSRGSDENIPRQAPCVTCVAGRIFSPWKAKKNGRRKGREGRGKAGLQRPSSPSGWRRRFKVRGIRMNYAFGAACVQSCGASLSRRKFLLRFHLARIWISVEPMEKCTGWEVAGEAQANSEDGSLRSS